MRHAAIPPGRTVGRKRAGINDIRNSRTPWGSRLRTCRIGCIWFSESMPSVSNGRTRAGGDDALGISPLAALRRHHGDTVRRNHGCGTKSLSRRPRPVRPRLHEGRRWCVRRGRVCGKTRGSTFFRWECAQNGPLCRRSGRSVVGFRLAGAVLSPDGDLRPVPSPPNRPGSEHMITEHGASSWVRS